MSTTRGVARMTAAAMVLVLAALVGVLLLALPRSARHVMRWFARTVARALLVSLGVRREIRGPVPRGASLVVANHLSWLDILAALASWRCTFVAKREIAAWPLVGAIASRLGVIFVDRTRKRDLLRSIPAIERAFLRGETVLLFPEGTTSRGDDVLPFRSALLESVERRMVPVFPLAIDVRATRGDARALTWCDDETLLGNIPRIAALDGAAIRLQVAAPVWPSGDRKALTAEARRQVRRRRQHWRSHSRPTAPERAAWPGPARPAASS